MVKIVLPDLSDLETQDLRIWEAPTKGPSLRPIKPDVNLPEAVGQWQVEGGEIVLFQR